MNTIVHHDPSGDRTRQFEFGEGTRHGEGSHEFEYAAKARASEMEADVGATMSPSDDRLRFTRLSWDRSSCLTQALGSVWVVVTRIDGTEAPGAGVRAVPGADVQPLGYYDEWYVFAEDPGPLNAPLPSFVNDGNVSLLFQSAESFGRRNQDLLDKRFELTVYLEAAIAESNAIALVWGHEEILIAALADTQLAQTLEGAGSTDTAR